MKIRDDFNEFGTPITVHLCEFCGNEFTVCPPVLDEKLDQWRGCLAVECPSYDPKRDIDKLFDNPLIYPEAKIIGNDLLN